MKTILSILYFCLFVITLCCSANAQQFNLKVGDRVRIIAPTTSDKPIIGNISNVSSDDLLLIRNNDYYYFPFRSIDRLDVSLDSRKRPLRGLVIGSLTLGTLAGAGWALSYSECYSREMFGCVMHPSNRGHAFVMGMFSGGIIGGFLGLIIGSTITFDKWERVSIGADNQISQAYPIKQRGLKLEYRFR